MSENRIQELNASSFLGLNNLNQDLYLERSKIRQFEDGAFDGLLSLKKLNLSRNSIKEPKSKSFSGMINLEEFNIKRCLI